MAPEVPGPQRLPAPSAALIILDGWGLAPEGPGNAVSLASTPHFDELWERYPHTQLSACGRDDAQCRIHNLGSDSIAVRNGNGGFLGCEGRRHRNLLSS